ncbi:MAG: hypothetical protein V4549_00295 [Bacteroidota bacterium]
MHVTKHIRLLTLSALISITALLNAQSTRYIVKGGPEFSGGVFIGWGAKINGYGTTTLLGGTDSTTQSAWKDYAGVTQAGNVITKTASNGWGNAGAISYNQLKRLENGWIAYNVDALINTFEFGLSTNSTTDFDSIQYAVMLDSGQISVYNSGVLIGNYGSAAINDIIHIERIGNVLFYTKNEIVFYNQEVNAKEVLQINVSLYTIGTTFQIESSFGLGNLFKPYSTLRKKLNGGFYLPILGKLYFKFDGEYNSGVLNYKVVDNLTGDTVSVPSINTTVKSYGDNRYELNLEGTLTSGGNYYTLQVTTEKNVSYYLRFKY